MAAYVATSWGRTRRPKEMEERLPDSSYNTSPTKANIEVMTTNAHLNAALNSTTPGRNGYATENQRYLHVFVKDNASAPGPATTNAAHIYVYNYAFKEWGPLYVKKPDDAGYEIATVAETGAKGVGATYVFDISGIDRVAFVKSSTDGPHRIRAACSTF